MNLAAHSSEAPRQKPVLTDAEMLLETFALQACLIVDEKSRIISAASLEPTPLLQNLADVAPTMALLPECRSLHLNYLRRSEPTLQDHQVSSSRFEIAGRRFFICAFGDDATRRQKDILQTLLYR